MLGVCLTSALRHGDRIFVIHRCALVHMILSCWHLLYYYYHIVADGDCLTWQIISFIMTVIVPSHPYESNRNVSFSHLCLHFVYPLSAFTFSAVVPWHEGLILRFSSYLTDWGPFDSNAVDLATKPHPSVSLWTHFGLSFKRGDLFNSQLKRDHLKLVLV